MGEEEPGPTWFCSGFGVHRKAGADRSNSSQALDQDLEIFEGRTGGCPLRHGAWVPGSTGRIREHPKELSVLHGEGDILNFC